MVSLSSRWAFLAGVAEGSLERSGKQNDLYLLDGALLAGAITHCRWQCSVVASMVGAISHYVANAAGLRLSHQYGFIWPCMGPYCSLWLCLGLYGFSGFKKRI